MSFFIDFIKNDNGMSLVETIAAIALFAIVCLPVFMLISKQQIQIGLGKDRLLATTLVQELAEDLLSDYDQKKIDRFQEHLNKYNFTASVEEDSIIKDKVNKIAVTVYYKDDKKHNQKKLTYLEFLVYDGL